MTPLHDGEPVQRMQTLLKLNWSWSEALTWGRVCWEKITFDMARLIFRQCLCMRTSMLWEEVTFDKAELILRWGLCMRAEPIGKSKHWHNWKESEVVTWKIMMVRLINYLKVASFKEMAARQYMFSIQCNVCIKCAMMSYNCVWSRRCAFLSSTVQIEVVHLCL